jgi:hypothetical protein
MRDFFKFTFPWRFLVNILFQRAFIKEKHFKHLEGAQAFSQKFHYALGDTLDNGMQQLRPNNIFATCTARAFLKRCAACHTACERKFYFWAMPPVGPKQGKRSPQASSQELNHF